MLASDVMTRNIVSVGCDAPIRDAIRLMLDNKVSGLPVVDADGKLVGVLTEGDLLHRSEIATEKHHWRWLEFLLGPGRMASEYVRTHGRVVDEVMTREVVSIGVDTPLDDIVAPDGASSRQASAGNRKRHARRHRQPRRPARRAGAGA